ncbi:hypothetical protein Patl1_07294 [Pistacia atlantica]|uniref:Uncharacterized protein n=1 Tax=Pistacia atlantica TaxID=434234 RepID=A0ACC1AKD9_9ROSI|nr:hypothetical protein Patl1_07294 [Pistacia atlantica]
MGELRDGLYYFSGLRIPFVAAASCSPLPLTEEQSPPSIPMQPQQVRHPPTRFKDYVCQLPKAEKSSPPTSNTVSSSC